MKVAELKAILATVPDDYDVAYRDPNWGGKGDAFTVSHITVTHDDCRPWRHEEHTVLITCPYWEPVD